MGILNVSWDLRLGFRVLANLASEPRVWGFRVLGFRILVFSV